MGNKAVLAAQAARLNCAVASAGMKTPVPTLYFFTDPARTPDPAAIAAQLPRGTAVVFRHFGRPELIASAAALRKLCRRRGLVFLVAGDAKLARQLGADGVHWPENRAPRLRLPPGRGMRLQTISAHSRAALAKARGGAFDAAILSPVLESRSPSATLPHARILGARHAGALARRAGLPVIALGGINAATARMLKGRGFAGLAAIDAFLD